MILLLLRKRLVSGWVFSVLMLQKDDDDLEITTANVLRPL